MNKRVALKTLKSANPRRRAAARAVLAAGRRVMRYAWRDQSPRCPDCPIGGRDEHRKTCARTRTCDREAAAETLAVDVACGRYPWGPWRCAMQVASGEGAGVAGTHRIVASLQVNGIELLPGESVSTRHLTREDSERMAQALAAPTSTVGAVFDMNGAGVGVTGLAAFDNSVNWTTASAGFSNDPWPFPLEYKTPTKDQRDLLEVLHDLVVEYAQTGGPPSALVDAVRVAYQAAYRPAVPW